MDEQWSLERFPDWDKWNELIEILRRYHPSVLDACVTWDGESIQLTTVGLLSNEPRDGLSCGSTEEERYEFLLSRKAACNTDENMRHLVDVYRIPRGTGIWSEVLQHEEAMVQGQVACIFENDSRMPKKVVRAIAITSALRKYVAFGGGALLPRLIVRTALESSRRTPKRHTATNCP